MQYQFIVQFRDQHVARINGIDSINYTYIYYIIHNVPIQWIGKSLCVSLLWRRLRVCVWVLLLKDIVCWCEEIGTKNVDAEYRRHSSPSSGRGFIFSAIHFSFCRNSFERKSECRVKLGVVCHTDYWENHMVHCWHDFNSRQLPCVNFYFRLHFFSNFHNASTLFIGSARILSQVTVSKIPATGVHGICFLGFSFSMAVPSTIFTGVYKEKKKSKIMLRTEEPSIDALSIVVYAEITHFYYFVFDQLFK